MQVRNNNLWPFSTKWIAVGIAATLSVSASAITMRVDKEAPDGGNGQSWAEAYNDLQWVLDRALPGDQVWVKEGTYYPDEGEGQTDNLRSSTFELEGDVYLYGGFAGTETLVTQRDLFSHETILSGDLEQDDDPNIWHVESHDDNAWHVITGTDHGDPVEDGPRVDGFTITGGNSDGTDPNDPAGWGAGVLQGGRFVRCTFQWNRALRGGGAVASNHPVIIYNCRFHHNYAGENDYAEGQGMGGAVVVTPIDDSNGYLSYIVNSVFYANKANFHGGAIAVWTSQNQTRVEISNCSIGHENETNGNWSYYGGGGVWVYYGLNDEQVVARLSNCVIDHNKIQAGAPSWWDILCFPGVPDKPSGKAV